MTNSDEYWNEWKTKTLTPEAMEEFVNRCRVKVWIKGREVLVPLSLLLKYSTLDEDEILKELMIQNL